MIGAEILAMVALFFGGTYGLVGMLRRAQTVRDKKKRLFEQETLMQSDLRTALHQKGHRAIDEFLVLWGDKLPKGKREEIEKVREDRYISDDDAGAKKK